MTREDEDLLLKYLCMALPYGVMVNYGEYEGCDYKLTLTTLQDFPIEDLKPYLRPMSSMTEEEKRELQSFFPGSFGNQWLDVEEGYIDIHECESTTRLYLYDADKLIEWLNRKMFDYRGLIPKGQAIEVTDDNNPYKD